MVPLLLVLVTAVLAQSGPDGSAEPATVLVRSDDLSGDKSTVSVQGWNKIGADVAVPSGVEVVPNVYLDLLAPHPSSEPLSDGQWAIGTIGLARAWQESTGKSEVVVAVVDSGITLQHPELAPRLFHNPGEIPGDGVDDDGNGLIDDVTGWDVVDNDADPTDPSSGHGTEVTGVAAASLNQVGIAGVAPGVTILPIRACNQSCELFAVAWAVEYATDMGADIINLSLGGFAAPGPLTDAVDYAADAGVLIVAAAGNGATDIDGRDFVPATLPSPSLVTVAATDRDDTLWTGSNTGVSSVDLGAPGVEILTSTLAGLGDYRLMTGTSLAAPHVTGTAALMLSVGPDLSPPQLIDLMTRYGQTTADLVGKTSSGTRLRADHAVVAARLIDIEESVFGEAIVDLTVAGITQGCNPPADDRYCPDESVTRGQMAAFLDRALDLPPGPDVFSDDDDSIFEGHIDALAQAGITHGCNPPANDNFCPHEPITREEMAALLDRALDLPPGPDAFSDDDSIFEGHIDALAQAGITHGCNPPANDHFCPLDPVTRGQMAAFLHRALS